MIADTSGYWIRDSKLELTGSLPKEKAGFADIVCE